MAGRVLLDTSIIVELLRRTPAAERVVSAAAEVYVPVVSLGELFYGAEGARIRED